MTFPILDASASNLSPVHCVHVSRAYNQSLWALILVQNLCCNLLANEDLGATLDLVRCSSRTQLAEMAAVTIHLSGITVSGRGFSIQQTLRAASFTNPSVAPHIVCYCNACGIGRCPNGTHPLPLSDYAWCVHQVLELDPLR